MRDIARTMINVVRLLRTRDPSRYRELQTLHKYKHLPYHIAHSLMHATVKMGVAA